MSDITYKAERATAYLNDEFFQEEIIGKIQKRYVTALCEHDPSDTDGLLMARLKLEAINLVVSELNSKVSDYALHEKRERHRG